jgi:DNA-binding Lrp family transcriptional regulator
MERKMDELLRILRKNALETPKNLSRMLKMPESKVKSKIRKYEAEGIIKGYQALVNEDRLDIENVSAVIEVKITPEREGGFDKVATRIAKFSEVESMFLMSGGFDLLVFVKGRNLKEVAGFVSEKLSTIAGVLSTATHFQLKTYKDHGVLMFTEKEDERLKVSP